MRRQKRNRQCSHEERVWKKETRELAQGRDVEAKEQTLKLILEESINNFTGTDGFRVLCHQFSPSSLPRQEYCIRRCNACEASEEPAEGSPPPAVIKHRRPGPKHLTYGIPTSKWSIVVQRVAELKEPLRTVAAYGVSHETMRRISLLTRQWRGQQDA